MLAAAWPPKEAELVPDDEPEAAQAAIRRRDAEKVVEEAGRRAATAAFVDGLARVLAGGGP